MLKLPGIHVFFFSLGLVCGYCLVWIGCHGSFIHLIYTLKNNGSTIEVYGDSGADFKHPPMSRRPAFYIDRGYRGGYITPLSVPGFD